MLLFRLQVDVSVFLMIEICLLSRRWPTFSNYCPFLRRTKLPESAQMYPLLGLNLLFLLSQNRVAEFHIELELLPVDKILNNVYIKHPVSLEQYIMEGSYNKVRMAQCCSVLSVLEYECRFFVL